MSDAQDRAEALDDDKTSADYPPDEPWGVDEPEVTQEGEWAQETFEERTARLNDEDPQPERELIQPLVGADDAILDDEAQAVAESEPSGGVEERLAESTDEDSSAQLTGDGVPAPAEEAALHIEEP